MIEVTNLTKQKFRPGAFKTLYKKIFRKKFELSVVLASPRLMKNLNKEYRKKDKVADVLSFLIDKNQGEIFLNSREKNIPFLFVHGCLHLLGYDHESEKDAEIMERKEKEILGNAR